MAKGRKANRRLTKKMIFEKLQDLFSQHPNENLTFKYIFKQLKFDTHPAKMLAVDAMEDMAWDDFLSKSSENSY